MSFVINVGCCWKGPSHPLLPLFLFLPSFLHCTKAWKMGKVGIREKRSQWLSAGSHSAHAERWMWCPTIPFLGDLGQATSLFQTFPLSSVVSSLYSHRDREKFSHGCEMLGEEQLQHPPFLKKCVILSRKHKRTFGVVGIVGIVKIELDPNHRENSNYNHARCKPSRWIFHSCLQKRNASAKFYWMFLSAFTKLFT